MAQNYYRLYFAKVAIIFLLAATYKNNQQILQILRQFLQILRVFFTTLRLSTR